MYRTYRKKNTRIIIKMKQGVDIQALLQPRRQIARRRHSTYSKVLELVHRRIRYNARQRPNCNWCVYMVPKFVAGLPRFNVDTCTRYCLAKLRENGFDITFVPPRTIIISWQSASDRAVRAARAERLRVCKARCRQKTLELKEYASIPLKDNVSATAYLDAPAPRFSHRRPPRILPDSRK